MAAAKKRSNVWKFFEVKDNKSQCNLCGQRLAFAGGSTSSMKNHLKFKHAMIDATGGGGESVTKSAAQSTIKGVFAGYQQKYEVLTKKLALVCVQDLRPVSLVSGSGFIEFCYEMNAGYAVPSYAMIHNYILHMYKESKDKVVKVFANDKTPVALSTDMWRSFGSQTAHNYLTVTAHFINEQWKLVSYVLATRKLEDGHTGENIAKHLTDVQEEFAISMVSAMTTDNAINNTVAACVTGYGHVRCFAHTLQQAVNEGLGGSTLIGKVIDCASKLITVLEDHLDNPDAKLKVTTDAEIHWTAIYFMLERLLHLRETVDVLDTLNKCFVTHELTDIDWMIIENLLPVLKPLVSATEVLSTEEYPTCSDVIPITFGLITNHLVASEVDTVVVRDFKERVTSGLRSRVLAGEYWIQIPMIATALDPRYKRLKFLSDEQRGQLTEKINELMSDEHGEGEGSQPEDYLIKQEKLEKLESHQAALQFLMGDMIDDESQMELESTNEYEKFLAETSKALNPLEWWGDNAKRYPRLSKLAKKYLAIPATSVPSEHAFSSERQTTIIQQRAALEPTTVDAVIFLNKNLKGHFQTTPTGTDEAASSIPGCSGSIQPPLDDLGVAQPVDLSDKTLMSLMM